MCVSRINQAEEEGISVVDVDGSYVHLPKVPASSGVWRKCHTA